MGNSRKPTNYFGLVLGILWICLCYYAARYSYILPYIILVSIAGAFYSGFFGFVLGSLIAIAGHYCIESNTPLLNDLICLPLAYLFVIIVGTQIDKWKKRKKLHGTHNGEDKDTDSTSK